MINQAALRLTLLSTSIGLSMLAQPTSVQRGAIPYTLEFTQVYGDTSPTPAPVNPPPPPQLPPNPAPPPALQPFHSYCVAVDPSGGWYLVGGRWWQGLHQFRSNQGAQNFLPKGTNPYLWYIDPVAKTATQLLDLRTLPASLSAPLMSTNSQCLYDPSSDSWLIGGGYGVDPASSNGNMRVFDILLRLNPRRIAAIARNTAVSPSARLQAIQAAIQVAQGAPPGLFDVTGGQLRVLGPAAAPTYVLLFGQKFTGNYNPFNQPPDQDYTEEIRYFRISQNPFRVISSGRLTAPSPTGPNADHPYHRRDLPIVNSVDPATGSFRISALGGVFPPGLIAGYLYPVQVIVRNNLLTPVIDRASVKRFSQYECPTVVIWDAAGRTIYHTSFGGIGHYYYHYNRFQQQVRQRHSGGPERRPSVYRRHLNLPAAGGRELSRIHRAGSDTAEQTAGNLDRVHSVSISRAIYAGKWSAEPTVHPAQCPRPGRLHLRWSRSCIPAAGDSQLRNAGQQCALRGISHTQALGRHSRERRARGPGIVRARQLSGSRHYGNPDMTAYPVLTCDPRRNLGTYRRL